MLERATSEGDRPGDRRRVETTMGGHQVERLTAFDPERHFYRYTLEETELPVADYTAELRVDGDGASGSLVTWSAYFEVAGGDERRGVGMVREFLTAGLMSLEEECAGF